MSDRLILFIAQIPEPVWTGMAQAGILAPVLIWFMWRDGKRDEKLENIATSLNHLARGLALEVLSRPSAHERAKVEANDILSQIALDKPTK
ncbi:MAG TPA: hypothetical protein VEC57_00025 [Candidatus Limnocylindrales bacterium]|nr:hypothetical protein [Candidatus Limnocylindrales bacterium]